MNDKEWLLPLKVVFPRDSIDWGLRVHTLQYRGFTWNDS